MGMNRGNISNAPEKTAALFDPILWRHVQRLVGSEEHIGTLPLNLETLACFIALVEREAEIESLPSSPPERFSGETLARELMEMGFDAEADLKAEIAAMVEKGEIHLDEEGRFCPGKSATDMVQLLNRIFPGMPGMSLLAYIIQTIDEVHSGRKGLEEAISQFDQVLQKQGAPLKESGHKDLKSGASGGTPGRGPFSVLLARKRAPASPVKPIGPARRMPRWTPSTHKSGSKILSCGATSKQVEIRELRDLFRGNDEAEAGQDPTTGVKEREGDVCEEETQDRGREGGEFSGAQERPNEAPAINIETPRDQDRAVTDEADASVGEVLPDYESAPCPVGHKEKQGAWNEEKAVGAGNKGPGDESSSLIEISPSVAADLQEKDHDADDEEEIEKGIAAFEEDLSLQCPICRAAKIFSETTTRGKTYYKCSNKKCNFLSWGKPYHIVCSRCNNPFLVEVTGRDGRKMLRCPRATCRHVEEICGDSMQGVDREISPPGEITDRGNRPPKKPVRRVVRRRLVRRKTRKH
ncbi:MAG: hypothetical protein JRH06_17560 [Deltaproteobacteria bacterium]|nr:hypothetical protein [Deltaproteobacteria bacterium]